MVAGAKVGGGGRGREEDGDRRIEENSGGASMPEETRKL